MRRILLGLILALIGCDDPVSISPRARLDGEWVYAMEIGVSIGLSCNTAGHIVVRPAGAGSGTIERFEPAHYGCYVEDGDVTNVVVVDSIGEFTLTTPNCTLTGAFVTSDSLAGAVTCTVPYPRNGTWAAGRAGPPATLDLGPALRIAAVGTRLDVAAVLRDAHGRRLMGRSPEWSSLNTSVASVTAQDDSAEVLALAVGAATVRARFLGLESSISIQVSVPTFTEITAGYRFTCGKTAPGDVWCWGANYHGQLGDGSRRGSLGPVRVAGDLKFSDVSASAYHACGVSAAALYCWGYNYAGQLGLGDTIWRASPTRIAGTTAWAQVSTGWNHTCAVDTDHAVWCWGSQNLIRGIGTESGTDRLRPARVLTSTAFDRVGVGSDHSCALTSGGAGYCWGYTSALGTGAFNPGDTVPVPVSGNHTFTALSVNALRTCAITASGAPYCWGLRVPSSGPVVDSIARVPELEVAGRSFSAISTSTSFTCGIDASDGTAWCWGSNYLGQLGDGTTSYASPPVAVAGGLAFTRIAVGATHACGIATNGATYCWGFNDVGQLGDGTITDRHVPTKVVGQP